MKTCRDIIIDAFGALGVIPLGCQPTADELDGGLSAIETIVLEIHGARGPLREIDVSVDYLASENERVRVESGANVVVTLPNSIVSRSCAGLLDYGFEAQTCESLAFGSTSAADGYQSRPPHDGARIEIVGVSQAIYFYRSDLNAWVGTSPLTLDVPPPFNGRYDGALAALVADRLCDRLNIAPSSTLGRRLGKGNAALLFQSARARGVARSSYL